MPSNKLSGRRSTARKPPICISKPPLIPPILTRCLAKLAWKSTAPPTPPLDLDGTWELKNSPDAPTAWNYTDETSGPLELRSIELIADDELDENFVMLWSQDASGTPHSCHKYWPPGTLWPFDVVILEWDYQSHPTDQITLRLHPG